MSLTLTISTQVAEERLRVRVGHETIKSAEQALEILPHFLRTYQKATTEEGFNYVLTWPAAKMSMEPGMEEVKEILFERLGNEEERADGVLPKDRSESGERWERWRRSKRQRRVERERRKGCFGGIHASHHQPYPSRGLPHSFRVRVNRPHHLPSLQLHRFRLLRQLSRDPRTTSGLGTSRQPIYPCNQHSANILPFRV